MKRLLVLLVAASIAAIAVPACAHAQAPQGTQATVRCVSDCGPDVNATVGSENRMSLRTPPAARPAMFMAVIFSTIFTLISAAILAGRLRRQRRSSEAREAEMLQELVLQAAVLRKQGGAGAPTAMPMRSAPKEDTVRRAAAAQTAAQTGDYWAYQSRRLGVGART